jgi:hypothetical protein
LLFPEKGCADGEPADFARWLDQQDIEYLSSNVKVKKAEAFDGFFKHSNP